MTMTYGMKFTLWTVNLRMSIGQLITEQQLARPVVPVFVRGQVDIGAGLSVKEHPIQM